MATNAVRFFTTANKDGIIFTHNLQRKIKRFSLQVFKDGFATELPPEAFSVVQNNIESLVLVFGKYYAEDYANRTVGLQVFASKEAAPQTEEQILITKNLKQKMNEISKNLAANKKLLKTIQIKAKTRAKRAKKV